LKQGRVWERERERGKKTSLKQGRVWERNK
jgi:hypothetical protein